VMQIGSKSFIEVEKMTRDVRRWIRTSTAPSGGRRNERENTARRGSKDEPNRSDETLAKPSAEKDWQGMVGPDPAFYLKDNGQRK
jgi:hypothetical protein